MPQGGAGAEVSVVADDCESGPGELDDDVAGASHADDLHASRRGAASLRARTLNAFEEASFPAYPTPAPEEAPFALPDGLLDHDAPVSARKWYVRREERRALPHLPSPSCRLAQSCGLARCRRSPGT